MDWKGSREAVTLEDDDDDDDEEEDAADVADDDEEGDAVGDRAAVTGMVELRVGRENPVNRLEVVVMVVEEGVAGVKVDDDTEEEDDDDEDEDEGLEDDDEMVDIAFLIEAGTEDVKVAFLEAIIVAADVGAKSVVEYALNKPSAGKSCDL